MNTRELLVEIERAVWLALAAETLGDAHAHAARAHQLVRLLFDAEEAADDAR